MSNTNYFSGIVKILENPKQQLIRSKTLVTTCRVEIPQKRKNKIIRLVFWGNLAREVNKFYKLNDYILIEGYVSLRDQKASTISMRKSKQVTITVLRVFPILLNSDRIP
jgi:single-stranded DNA-binding protein